MGHTINDNFLKYSFILVETYTIYTYMYFTKQSLKHKYIKNIINIKNI